MMADPFLLILRKLTTWGIAREAVCLHAIHAKIRDELSPRSGPSMTPPYIGFPSIFHPYFFNIQISCIVARFPLHIQQMQRHLPIP